MRARDSSRSVAVNLQSKAVGGVVAPLEGGQTGLDCARWRRWWRPGARGAPLGDRGANGVRDTPSDRALSAPRSRRRSPDGARGAAGVRDTPSDRAPVSYT